MRGGTLHPEIATPRLSKLSSAASSQRMMGWALMDSPRGWQKRYFTIPVLRSHPDTSFRAFFTLPPRMVRLPRIVHHIFS